MGVGPNEVASAAEIELESVRFFVMFEFFRCDNWFL